MFEGRRFHINFCKTIYLKLPKTHFIIMIYVHEVKALKRVLEFTCDENREWIEIHGDEN